MARHSAWEKAMKDPHLMRLGDFLVHKESDAGWGWEDSEHLEEAFLAEPWMNWVQVVLAVNPEMKTKPFVVLSSCKDKVNHTECPFNNINENELRVFESLLFVTLKRK